MLKSTRKNCMYSLTNFKNFLFLVIFAISLLLSRKKFCEDKSEKLISEPHFLKVQTFIPPVKNVPGRWQTAKPFKTRFQKKRSKKSCFFFKLNIFIINNFLDQFRIYHWKGHVLNFTNISLSIFSVANSICYTASKTGVSFMPFWPFKG